MENPKSTDEIRRTHLEWAKLTGNYVVWRLVNDPTPITQAEFRDQCDGAAMAPLSWLND